MLFKEFKAKSNRLDRDIKELCLVIILQILIALCFLAQCASLISYYDPTTYKNLTELKPEVAFLYETFTSDSIDMEKIDAIRLRLAQVYEYEKGKGPKNIETYEQIKIIQDMFERHVKERLEHGTWSNEHMENKKTIIQEAFDIAIQTERLKNKNE